MLLVLTISFLIIFSGFFHLDFRQLRIFYSDVVLLCKRMYVLKNNAFSIFLQLVYLVW